MLKEHQFMPSTYTQEWHDMLRNYFDSIMLFLLRKNVYNKNTVKSIAAGHSPVCDCNLNLLIITNLLLFI